jgi:apolipoprotein N-acyltransferase
VRLSTPLAVAASALAFGLYVRVAWPWFLLGWVGLVPWLAALDRTRSLGAALGAGLLMAGAFVLAVFPWFGSAIGDYAGIPTALALLLLVLLSPLIQPQFLSFALARHIAPRNGAGFARTALAAALLYVGTEWLVPKLFADTIGHGFLVSARLRQAADLAGAGGLTFVLLVANQCVHEALGRARRVGGRSALPPLGTVAAFVLALLAYGELRQRQLGAGGDGPPVTIAVVQGGLGRYDRMAAEMGTFDAVRTILDTYYALSTAALEAGGVDLLVWPETVYPTTFAHPKSADGAAFDQEIASFAAAAGVPLVFGAYDHEDGKEFNAAFFLSPASDGRVPFEAYRKAALFPFTEHVPAPLDSAALRRWLPWLGTWQPGEGAEVVSLALRGGRTLRLAPLICYDAVDPSHALEAVCEGAEVILALSNDSWFDAGGGPRLHLVVSAFRSIETRRPQVRGTTTGISALISPTGEILETVGLRQRGILIARVQPVRETGTLMLTWGDWFGPAALAVGLLLLFPPQIFLAGERRGVIAVNAKPVRQRAAEHKGGKMEGRASFVLRLFLIGAVAVTSSTAMANTVTQNTSWTIDRAGTTAKYRVVGYGDSIYAGYYGSISRVAKRAAPWVDGEYASNAWSSDIEVIRRTKSGAKANDIYNNKIVAERSYMQATSTRVVTFEMCGNDFLQARSSFAGQSGTCNYGPLNTALSDCTNYQALAMQAINQYAHANTRLKVISNIYYPGYDADNALSGCTDSGTGQKVNKQNVFLPYLARSNWRACNFASQYGFACADSFAQYMGADYDSNGDGQVDSDALRYVQGESENDYVNRISSTQRSTIRDANTHFVSSSTSYDYIQSDNVHPTYYGSATIYVGLFGGTGSGSGAPDFSGSQITGGKNPQWNRYGHERMGWALSVFNPATP